MNNNLREFLWDIHRSEAETVRTTDDVTDITDKCAPQTFTYPSRRENDIYNVGVITGSLALVDNLYKAGYKITAPNGDVLEKPETSFTDEFNEGVWVNPSN